MKLHFTALCIVLCICSAKLISQPAVGSQKVAGGDLDDKFSCMALTADGGVVEGGSSSSGASGDKTDTSRGLTDYWIVKFDANGKKQWDKTIGGSDYDFLVSIDQTNDGGYILGGFSYSNKSGEKSENTIGFPDFWIVKLDKNHNIQWDKTVGISNESYSRNFFKSLVQTHDGGFLLAGVLYGDDEDSAPFLLIKLDVNGNVKFDTTLAGYALNAVIQQTDDKGYLLAGSNYNYGLSEVYYTATKFDRVGRMQWSKNYEVADGHTSYLTAVVQTHGTYLLCGYSDANAVGIKSENSRGGYDYWLLQIDKAGNAVNDKTIGGSGYDYLRSVEATDDGGLILGGYSTSNRSGEKTEDNRGGGGFIDNDYWIVKLNANAKIEWDKTIGGSANDFLYGIKEVTANKYLGGGYSNSEVSGDKTKPSEGGNDYWSVVLNSSLKTNVSTAADDDIHAKGINFSVFPNPAINTLSVTCSGTVVFTLTDQSGKMMLQATITNSGTINVSRLRSGVYFLRAPSGETKQVVIRK